MVSGEFESFGCSVMGFFRGTRVFKVIVVVWLTRTSMIRGGSKWEMPLVQSMATDCSRSFFQRGRTEEMFQFQIN